jgi:hypothetical protein
MLSAAAELLATAVELPCGDAATIALKKHAGDAIATYVKPKRQRGTWAERRKAVADIAARIRSDPQGQHNNMAPVDSVPAFRRKNATSTKQLFAEFRAWGECAGCRTHDLLVCAAYKSWRLELELSVAPGTWASCASSGTNASSGNAFRTATRADDIMSELASGKTVSLSRIVRWLNRLCDTPHAPEGPDYASGFVLRTLVQAPGMEAAVTATAARTGVDSQTAIAAIAALHKLVEPCIVSLTWASHDAYEKNWTKMQKKSYDGECLASKLLQT